MHAAGRAMFAPMSILVARGGSAWFVTSTNEQTLTDITPDDSDLCNGMAPDDRINGVYDIDGEQPDDHGQGGDVSSAPVPWRRDEDEDGGED